MPAYTKVGDMWRTVTSIYTKVGSGWRPVASGYTKIGSTWSQFWPGTRAYTFAFGNTVHIGTNGYISLDTGQSSISITDTVGRVLGILPADLEMNSVRWASSSTRFYVFWRGKRFSVGSDFEIEYEVHFIDGQDYALIKLVSFPTSTYSNTAYYVDGSRAGYSAITSGRTVGGEYRVYFDTTAAFATSFTEFGSSTDPVWLASSSVTSGSNDDGYFSIVANQGASSQAPTSVTASSITKTSATVSWTAPLRESRGMSAIQSYDYSINFGSSWVSTSTNTSVNLTGLTANTSYTVLVRANNYYFTGTNYGIVTFSTTAGPVNTSLPTLSTNTNNFSSGSIVTVSEGTWTGTSSYKYEILYSSDPSVPTSGSGLYSTNASNQYTITLSDATAPSYYFRAKVTGYDGANQTGDSVIAYGVVSSRLYIVPTTSISVGTATSTGFTISGAAGPVTSFARYVVIKEIYIYNSSQTLISTITTGLPTPLLNSGNWSYVWTGGAASTTYYAKVKVESTSSDVQEFTTAFSSSITTSADVVLPGAPTGLSVSRSVGGNFMSTSLFPSASGNSTKTQTWSFGRNTTFTVNFTRGSNATSSEMYYSTSNSTPSASTSQNGGTSASASGSFSYVGAASTTSGNDYAVYFWVRSTTATDNSAWTYAGTQNVDTPEYSGFEIRLYRTNTSGTFITAPGVASGGPGRNTLSYTWTNVALGFSHVAQVRLTFDTTALIRTSS